MSWLHQQSLRSSIKSVYVRMFRHRLVVRPLRLEWLDTLNSINLVYCVGLPRNKHTQHHVTCFSCLQLALGSSWESPQSATLHTSGL